MALIVAAVLVANLPSLLHLVTVNPLDLQSHLDPISAQGLLPGFPSIDPNDGITTQALGHRAALDWLTGNVPWWNPYEGVGVPLAGEMASAAFFPLVFLLLYSAGVLFFHLALELGAGLATYALTRRLGLGVTASFIAGVAFALNGTFSWLGDATVNPIPFLPLMLLGIELCRAPRATSQRWGVVLLAVSLALSIYAGFPETTGIDALFAGFWFLLRLQGLQPLARWHVFRRSLVAIGVGLLLAAPLMVAFLDYVARGDLGGHGPGFSNLFLPRSAIAMLSLPYVYGPIFGLFRFDPTGTLGAIWSNIGGYLSPSLVALAALAVVGAVIRRQDRWLRLGLVVWIVLSLSTTFGVPIVGRLLELVPGVSHTAFFRYAPPSWELATIVLAAMAVDDLARSRITVKIARVSGALTIFSYALSAAIAFRLISHLRGAPHILLYAGTSLAWALIIAVAVTAIAGWGRPSGSRLRGNAHFIAATAVALDVVAMFLVPQFSAPQKAPLDTRPVQFLQAHLGLARFFTLGPIQPDYGSYYQISEANTADLPLPSLWAEYVTTHLAPNTNPITFSGEEVNAPRGPSPLQQFIAYFRNYEQIGVKFLVVSATIANHSMPTRLGMRLVFADRVAIIYRLPHPRPFYQSESDLCKVRAVNDVVADVDCTAPGTILRREMYFPGWAATAAGRSLSIQRADSIFQAVHVPAGQSTVRFDYQPPYSNAGLVAGGAGLVLLVGLIGTALVAGVRTRRRKAGRIISRSP
ncbi:MAG: hypothetical protein WAO09_03650 [Candidatus Dormiibacterota bacterium]